MAASSSNDTILEQLRNGSAQFELVSSSPVASISTPNPTPSTILRFFARVGPPPGGVSSSNSNIKVERFSVHKVTGDGRCMFRALVKGMARNKGITLTPRQERDNADELRAAVKEVICEDDNERRQYKEAVTAITVDEPLHRYCQRIGRSDFWGGESELLVLSKLCNQQIVVYIPETEHNSSKRGSGFIPIAEYGAVKKKQPRHVVRLLYSGKNHYDLLV
ncbi:OVARIAN TUMOR DOMAIN-containing deubiquitinating enzyme 3 [Spinacia oleracea]|uniref:Ubiquitin thioesterase OTU n=1 Tax=Spinacia oleracea TaxID=3562 RepID=A0A9R0J0W9_SPIOL|nr:OVARIAN TUMOR DOMAIN-containing deubiquitinating enzyme 3 [Spinacia oleracea]